MALVSVDLGSSVTVKGTLTDAAGAAVTGATVTCTIKHPDGTEDAPVAASEVGTTGVYTVDFKPDASGMWEVRFVAASPYDSASEGQVFVKTSMF